MYSLLNLHDCTLIFCNELKNNLSKISGFYKSAHLWNCITNPVTFLGCVAFFSKNRTDGECCLLETESFHCSLRPSVSVFYIILWKSVRWTLIKGGLHKTCTSVYHLHWLVQYFFFFFSLSLFIVMHQNTTANFLYVKTFLVINLILINTNKDIFWLAISIIFMYSSSSMVMCGQYWVHLLKYCTKVSFWGSSISISCYLILSTTI